MTTSKKIIESLHNPDLALKLLDEKDKLCHSTVKKLETRIEELENNKQIFQTELDKLVEKNRILTQENEFLKGKMQILKYKLGSAS